MSIRFEKSTVPAILFAVFAIGLLVVSVRTTTLAQRAADEARDGLIPLDKAPQALDFTLPVVSGNAPGAPSTVTLLTAAKKTPVVFSFWAGYCQYCPLEMNHLQSYSQAYKGKVQFYTINSNDAPEAVRQYMAMHGFGLPVLSDVKHEVAFRYDVQSLPTLIIVDKSGRVRYVENGFDPRMDSVFPKLLNDLVKES